MARQCSAFLLAITLAAAAAPAAGSTTATPIRAASIQRYLAYDRTGSATTQRGGDVTVAWDAATPQGKQGQTSDSSTWS